MKNVLAIDKFSSFFNNIKKICKVEPLLKPFVTVKEVKFADICWSIENQKQFSDEQLKILSRDLKLSRDLTKTASFSRESKTSFLINAEHYLSEFIVSYCHTISEPITEIRPKFWICCGRSFLKELPPYPTAPALTK